MPDWLDLFLVAVMAVFAAWGYRQGFVAGVLSLTGFACGAAAGVAAAPALASWLVPPGPNRDFLAILLGFAAAVTGMLLTSVLAGLLRQVSRRAAGLADSVGGAALNVIFLLALAAAISSLAAGAPPGSLSRQIDRSLVLRAMNHVAPDLLNAMRVSMVKRLDDASGLIAADLPRPSRAVLTSPAADLAQRGVVKVKVDARSCSSSVPQSRDGSGFVIGHDHVLTNAHVLVRLTRPPVVALADGQQYQARVVLYDRARDIAVLYVPGLQATVLHFIWSAPFGASAVVAGFPGGGRFSLAPATIGSSTKAVVNGMRADWQVYLIRGRIDPGNSGSPVMAPGGRVYGVVFARAGGTPLSGWAMTASEVRADAFASMNRTRGLSDAQLGC